MAEIVIVVTAIGIRNATLVAFAVTVSVFVLIGIVTDADIAGAVATIVADATGIRV